MFLDCFTHSPLQQMQNRHILVIEFLRAIKIRKAVQAKIQRLDWLQIQLRQVNTSNVTNIQLPNKLMNHCYKNTQFVRKKLTRMS